MLKGPLFSMCSLVQLNLCCSFEALLPFVETERSFVTVVPQYSYSSKPFSSQCKFEWLFFSMCKRVLFWILRCQETTFTLGALESSIPFCVSFSYSLTSANLFKRLFSHRLHLKGRSSLWTTWWVASVSLVLKSSPHWSHCIASLLLWTVELQWHPVITKCYGTEKLFVIVRSSL